MFSVFHNNFGSLTIFKEQLLLFYIFAPMNKMTTRTVEAVQYLQPLREGGSLPAIIRADDRALYVLKFKGAGQGEKALIAEWIGGELARAMNLRVPELVFVELDEAFGRTEPDEEIQDLLKFSVGLNLGMAFLSEAIVYDPLVSEAESLEASKVVLLDSMISNIDRTVKNTNLLNWNNELWLIDHGASLYFHHNWQHWKTHLNRTFPFVKEHVLLKKANHLTEAVQEIKSLVNEEIITKIVNSIPTNWLEGNPNQRGNSENDISANDKRKAYTSFLMSRLSKVDVLAKEALDAK